ncbi:MAG: hypothetical protein LBP20_01105 [Treponema sp.]|jgi:hypothetical protein|nr:hypothetical protein [Treponema sp.]
MGRNSDYVPSRGADFDGWLENLVNYVTEKTGGSSPVWTHIPQSLVSGLSAAYTTWHAAYEKTLGAHTSVDTEAKSDARKAATAFVRPFVQQYLMFPPVTNEDRTAMRLSNKDTTRTPITVPGTRPVITDIRALGGYQIQIHFRDETRPDSRAVPYGCNGCLLNYTWSRERITDVAALKETQLMTRSPWIITLPPEAQTAFLSCAPRWQCKGDTGPWGDVKHVVVG